MEATYRKAPPLLLKSALTPSSTASFISNEDLSRRKGQLLEDALIIGQKWAGEKFKGNATNALLAMPLNETHGLLKPSIFLGLVNYHDFLQWLSTYFSGRLSAEEIKSDIVK